MLYHCFASFKQSLLDFFKLVDSFQLIRGVANIGREGVQNMHHWSKQTETTQNRVGQAGSCRHCSSHSSAASV